MFLVIVRAIHEMRFLFLYRHLNVLGGLETLIARMSAWLLEHGHEVTLIVEASGLEKRLMPKGLQLIEVGTGWDRLCYRSSAAKAWKLLDQPAPDVIKSFEAECSWIATILSAVIGSRPRVMIGDYGPGFVPDRKVRFRNLLYRILVRNVADNVPKQSRLFYSREQLEEFRSAYGSSQEGNIWILPVDDRKFLGIKRNPKWGHLVSIGRLDPMKEYNLHMVDVVDRLVHSGYDVTWTVYGDGSFEVPMRKRVAERSLEGRIHIKGRLSNERIGEALTDAYAFVGMGTAIIEASFCRVPGVVAMAHDISGVTYGPIYNFPPGNVGEFMSEPPNRTIELELARILKMTPGGYSEEMQRVNQYAQHYGQDNQMKQFLEICAKAAPASSSWSILLSYFLFTMARKTWRVLRRRAFDSLHSARTAEYLAGSRPHLL